MILIKRVSEGEFPKENIIAEFQEMEEWAGTFNAMVEQLRQKNSLERLLYEQDKMASLGHLSAAVAHEIRNPLASISSLTQLLAERQKDDRKVQEYTAVILQESKRLNLAIEQLLDFARPIPITFEHLSVREVVLSVITLLGYEAGKVGVKLEMATSKGVDEECRYPVAGDVNQLKQVMINLIRNSIQAQSLSGGEVVVTVCHSPDNNTVEIVVSDKGPGIPPDKAEKIFEPFFSTRKKGVGLGLSICRKIINGHGGKITFKNRTARGGAIFSIVLPYDTNTETGTGIVDTMDSPLKEAVPREIL
jgi:signal transduction histidine kinase